MEALLMGEGLSMRVVLAVTRVRIHHGCSEMQKEVEPVEGMDRKVESVHNVIRLEGCLRVGGLVSIVLSNKVVPSEVWTFMKREGLSHVEVQGFVGVTAGGNLLARGVDLMPRRVGLGD